MRHYAITYGEGLKGIVKMEDAADWLHEYIVGNRLGKVNLKSKIGS
ncbi:hypothetical protein [Paenibacillus dendrobii]|nr:hypothetical protein [Paenibacillus dendrobii]